MTRIASAPGPLQPIQAQHLQPGQRISTRECPTLRHFAVLWPTATVAAPVRRVSERFVAVKYAEFPQSGAIIYAQDQVLQVIVAADQDG